MIRKSTDTLFNITQFYYLPLISLNNIAEWKKNQWIRSISILLFNQNQRTSGATRAIIFESNTRRTWMIKETLQNKYGHNGDKLQEKTKKLTIIKIKCDHTAEPYLCRNFHCSILLTFFSSTSTVCEACCLHIFFVKLTVMWLLPWEENVRN